MPLLGIHTHRYGILRTVLLLWLCALASLGCGCNRQQDDSQANTTETLLKQAAREFTQYNFDASLRHFHEAAQASEVGSVRQQKALYGEAMTWWCMSPPSAGNTEKARELLHRIVEDPASDELARKATYKLARIAEVRSYPGDDKDLETARGYYLKVIENWPDTLLAHESALRYAGTWVQLWDDDEAIDRGIAFLMDWLEEHPGNPLEWAMWEYLAEAHFFYKYDPAISLECYLKADNIGFQDTGKIPLIYRRMVFLAENYTDRIDVAIEYRQRLITDFSFSGDAWESQQKLQRMQVEHPALNVQVPEIPFYRSSNVSFRKSLLDDPDYYIMPIDEPAPGAVETY